MTRELEEAAKTLGDRVRQKDATCEVSGQVSGTERLLVETCICVSINSFLCKIRACQEYALCTLS